MRDAKQDLSTLALSIFELNGHFLAIAEHIATQANLTATRWQILGAVENHPFTQAEVARKMGITRQSVQRTSNQLIDDGLLETIENPSHQKAKLLRPTSKGYEVLSKITPFHKAYAEEFCNQVGEENMHEIVEKITKLNNIINQINK